MTGSRHRVASPDEAAALLRALPEMDRAPWATAMYAGLRLGELRALEWEAVELERGLIRVEFNWDPKKGKVRPKSRSGQRTVAIPGVLRAYLEAHENISGRRSGLVWVSSPLGGESRPRWTPFASKTGRPAALIAIQRSRSPGQAAIIACNSGGSTAVGATAGAA